jgi:hypothetical protein
VDAVLDVHNEHSDNRQLSNCFPEEFGCGWAWPPLFPYPNLCNYFIWNFLEDTVYKNQPHTIEELKQILALLISISEETVVAVVKFLLLVADGHGH